MAGHTLDESPVHHTYTDNLELQINPAALGLQEEAGPQDFLNPGHDPRGILVHMCTDIQ